MGGAYFLFTDAGGHWVASVIAVLAALVALCTLVYLIFGRRAAIAFALGLLAIVAVLVAVPAIARDGYGDRPMVCAQGDMRCQQWIANVKQPDHRDQICCAEADAYITDDWQIDPKTGQLIAITTVDYPGMPKGTKIPIPSNKINRAADDGGNPSGHSVTFAAIEDGNPPEFFVYCYFGGTLS